MKKLFVYYSYTGSGDIVAEKFKEKGYDIQKVVRKNSLPKSFFWGVMAGGFLAGIKHKDKLVGFDADISDYDEIVVGSPVWNGRFASPVNTVLASLDFTGKKLSFVLYSGSGEAAKATKRILKEYPAATTVILKEPKKYPDELQRLSVL